MTLPLTRVLWRDAWFDLDAPDEIRADYTVETVGYILPPVVEDRGQITRVASEMTPDGPRAITNIWRDSIISQQELTVKVVLPTEEDLMTYHLGTEGKID